MTAAEGAKLLEVLGDQGAGPDEPDEPALAPRVLNLALDLIRIDRNVRQRFDEAAMEQLTDSIKRVGVLQPIVVRVDVKANVQHYVLVCGERRVRAARAAGLTHIPAVLRDLDEHQAREAQLVENLVRRDLDPIEEAEGLRELLDQHERTQQELGERIGVSQPYISNRLRLLKLPEEVQGHISRGMLTPGHAMALLVLEPAPEMLVRAAHHLETQKTSVAGAAEAIDNFLRYKGKYLGKYAIHFDAAGCANCGRTRQVTQYSGSKIKEPICLDVACWQRKENEALAARAAAEKSHLEELGATGVVVLQRQDLPEDRNAWRHLSYGLGDIPECAACANRVQVMLYPGNESSPVCLDTKCLDAKIAAADEKVKKEREELAAAQAKEAHDWAVMQATDGAGSTGDPDPAAISIFTILAGVILVGVAWDWRTNAKNQYVVEFLRARGHDLGMDEQDLVEGDGWPKLQAILNDLGEWERWALALEWAANALWDTPVMCAMMGRPAPRDEEDEEGDGGDDEESGGAPAGEAANDDGAAAVTAPNDPLTKEENA